MTYLFSLIRATHFLPTFTVTAVTTALAISVNHPRALLVMLAVLTGQMSVGWSNDAVDAQRDLLNQRTDKPTVRGSIASSALWVWALLSVVTCVVLSLAAAGTLGGLAHIAAVLSAWLYNLGLKTTHLSFVPYAVSFSLLPWLIGTPQWWVMIVFAIFGVGSHIANAVHDIDDDKRTGVFNIAVRMGRLRAQLSAVALVMLALVIAVVYTDPGFAWLVVAAVVTTAVLWKRLFLSTLVIALLTVGVLANSVGELFR